MHRGASPRVRDFPAGVALKCPILAINLAEMSSLRLDTQRLTDTLIAGVDLIATAREIVLVGSSGGGYPAMMIGMALARTLAPVPVRVIAMNAPTSIWPPEKARQNNALYNGMMRRVEQNQELRDLLEREGSLLPWLDRTAASEGANFRAVFVVSERHGRDMRHVRVVRGRPGVVVVSVPTSDHLAFRHWLALSPRLDDARLRKRITKHLSGPRTDKAAGGAPDADVQPGAEIDPAEVDRALSDLIERELLALKAYRALFPDLAALLRWTNENVGDLRLTAPESVSSPAPAKAG